MANAQCDCDDNLLSSASWEYSGSLAITQDNPSCQSFNFKASKTLDNEEYMTSMTKLELDAHSSLNLSFDLNDNEFHSLDEVFIEFLDKESNIIETLEMTMEDLIKNSRGSKKINFGIGTPRNTVALRLSINTKSSLSLNGVCLEVRNMQQDSF